MNYIKRSGVQLTVLIATAGMAMTLTGCGALTAKPPTGSFLVDTGACQLDSSSVVLDGNTFTACRMHLDGVENNYNWEFVVNPSAPWTASAPPVMSLNLSINQSVLAPATLLATGETTLYPATVAKTAVALLYVDASNQQVQGSGTLQLSSLGMAVEQGPVLFTGEFDVTLDNGDRITGSISASAQAPVAPPQQPSTQTAPYY